jgi:hypothetical protein
MYQIEDFLTTLDVNGIKIGGIISGSAEFVKFNSINEYFLKHFRGGGFDTIYLNLEKCTPEQLNIIDAAKQKIKSLVPTS